MRWFPEDSLGGPSPHKTTFRAIKMIFLASFHYRVILNYAKEKQQKHI